MSKQKLIEKLKSEMSNIHGGNNQEYRYYKTGLSIAIDLINSHDFQEPEKLESVECVECVECGL